MAVTLINDPNKKDDEENKPTSTPPIIGGATGPVSSAPAIGQTKPQNQAPKGTGFVGAQQIAQANTGNRLGSTVQSGISNIIGGARQGLGQAQAQFGQQLQQNTLQTDPNLQARQALIAHAQGLNAGESLSEQEMGDAQRYMGAFKGPQALNNAQALKTKAEQVANIGQNRNQLLSAFVGKPGYTQGQRGLDSLLLGKSSADINKAKAASRGIQGETQKALTTAEQQARNVSNQNLQFGKETENLVSQASTTAAQDLTNRIKSAQEAEALRKSNLENVYKPLLGKGEVIMTEGLKNYLDTQRNTLQGQLQPVVDKYGNELTGAQANLAAQTKAWEDYNTRMNASQELPQDQRDALAGQYGQLHENWGNAINQADVARERNTAANDALKNILSEYASTDVGSQYKSPNEQAAIEAMLGMGGDQFTGLDRNVLNQIVPRAQALGMDPGELIGEYLKNQEAQGIGRSGMVNDAEKARLNALNSIVGKQSEFGTTGNYQAGKTNLDLDQLVQRIQGEEMGRQGRTATPDDQKANLEAILSGMGYGQLGRGFQQDADMTLNALNDSIQHPTSAAYALSNPMLGGSLASGFNSTDMVAPIAESGINAGANTVLGGLGGGAAGIGQLAALLGGQNNDVSRMANKVTEATGKIGKATEGATHALSSGFGKLKKLFR